MSKIRVLRIINRLNLGGPTYNASFLTHYLSPKYETMLVAGMKDETEASSEFIPRSMGLTPHYIPEMYREIDLIKDYQAYRKIKKLISDFKPHIVHTHAAKSGAIGRLAAANSGVPVIIHTFHGHVFHSYFNPLKTRIFIEIERFLAKKSTHIIAISDRQKYELTHIYKVCEPEKVTVILLGFDLSKFQEDQQKKRARFRKEYQISDDEVAIGIIGRIVPIKNHELFIKAFKRVQEKCHKKIRGFIVGDGEYLDKIIALSKETGLDYTFKNENFHKASLTFTSWIKEIDYVNAGLDIIALTSNNEGTPVSLIEAQAANKPVVSTEVGGIRDVLIPGSSGLLSSAGDIEAFAQNLLRLIEDGALRESLGREGARYVLKKFHYSRLIGETDALYSRLLEAYQPGILSALA